MTEPALRTPVSIVNAAAIEETAAFIAGVQARSGQIPWYLGGHADPWDHVEAAMALDVAGQHERAGAAYDWLRRAQNPDGSWYRAYRGKRVTDAVCESNFAAYVAVGIWHHLLSTGDHGFVDHMWPTLCRAMGYVLGLQQPGGQISWTRGPDGEPAEALLTGCSSMLHSLRCALAIAGHRSDPQPDWELAAATLGQAIAGQPALFANRDRYSMDWYYPILGGAVRGPAALDRLARGWDRYVVAGLGVRCVDDEPWITVAETSELALTLCSVGDFDRAAELLQAVQRHRHPDGSYWTGYVYRDDEIWPNERPTWTAAAVVLAAAAVDLEPATAAVFGSAQAAIR
jgi:MMP endo-(1,4)-3-O-methyl-alpha-D-mannosidase